MTREPFSREATSTPASTLLPDRMKIPAIQIMANGGMMGGLTYIQIVALDMDVGNTGIGMLVFFYSLAFFTANIIFGRMSDMKGRRQFIRLGLITSALAFMTVFIAPDYQTLLLTRTLSGLCLGIYPPALVAYSIEVKRKLNKFASYGSIGWGGGILILGFVAQFMGVRWVFAVSSLFYFVGFLFALTLNQGGFHKVTIPAFPVAIIKKNMSLYAAILIRHSGAVMIWTFWPIYMVQELGLSLLEVGFIQATNMLFQFVVMFIFGERLKSSRSVMLGIVMSSAVFFSFTLAYDFWTLWLTQFGLATCWALIYVGSLRKLDECNVEKATANGLFTSVIAMSAILGPLMSTALIQVTDYTSIMYMAAVFSLISAVVYVILQRRDQADPDRAACVD